MGSSATLHQRERAGRIPIETRAHDAMEVDMNMNSLYVYLASG